MKKIMIYLLIILLMTGCTVKEKGEIDPVSESKPLILYEASGDDLFLVEAARKIDCDRYEDHHAGFSIPYPKDFVFRAVNPNLFMFISDNNSQITVSHNMMTRSFSGADSNSIKEFKDSFKTILKDEYIRLDYDKFYRRESQTVSSIKVASREPLVVAETYDNIKLSNDAASYVSHQFCEKRYYINYNNINTMISIISEDPKDYDVLDYIIKNIKGTDIRYDSYREIEGIKIPSSFQKSDVSMGNLKGFSYSSTGNDAFAGCFVEQYSGPVPLSDSYFNAVFHNAFFKDFSSNRYNNGDMAKFENRLKKSAASISCTINASSYSVPSAGNTYILEIYNDETRSVVIGYPVAKAGLMQTLADK